VVAGQPAVHDQTSGSDLALNAAGTAYTLTTWNNFKYTFDAAGRLSSLTDRIGNGQTITRAGTLIDFLTDSLGRTLDFGYDGNNKLVSVTSNPPGLSLSFGYAGVNCPAGNLCSATMPDNKTWTYEYTATGNNLTKVLDPLAHAEEINTYVGERVQSQQTEGSQNALVFSYPNNTTTTVTDGLNRTTAYTYDPKLLLITNVAGGPGCSCGGGQSRAFTFDRFLRKTSETDGLGATHTINWAYGRDVLVSYPNGFTDIEAAYPSPTMRTEPLQSGVSRTTTWDYYPLNDLARHDLVQKETVPSADTAGQNKETTLTFNSQGLLTTREEKGRISNVLTTYTTNFGYDTRGRLLTVNGPRTDVTDVTTYAYYADSDPDLAKRGQLQTVTDAANNVTTYAGGSAPFNT
jgi:YD repeat-containing protein